MKKLSLLAMLAGALSIPAFSMDYTVTARSFDPSSVIPEQLRALAASLSGDKCYDSRFCVPWEHCLDGRCETKNVFHQCDPFHHCSAFDKCIKGVCVHRSSR